MNDPSTDAKEDAEEKNSVPEAEIENHSSRTRPANVASIVGHGNVVKNSSASKVEGSDNYIEDSSFG